MLSLHYLKVKDTKTGLNIWHKPQVLIHEVSDLVVGDIQVGQHVHHAVGVSACNMLQLCHTVMRHVECGQTCSS